MRKLIRWLAGLQIAQGLLEVGVGVSTIVFQTLERESGDARADARELALAFSMALVLTGGLRAYAGVLCWTVRGRALGIASLILGVGSSLLCCPFALLLLMFGLVVYSNGDVIEAFRLRQGGASAEEALQGRDDIDALAAVFDPDEPAPGPLAERRVLDASIVEAVVALLPDTWNEAYLDLHRSPEDSRLLVALRDADSEHEIRPDTDLLDVLGALDEFIQVSGDYLERGTLHVWEDGNWQFEWL